MGRKAGKNKAKNKTASASAGSGPDHGLLSEEDDHQRRSGNNGHGSLPHSGSEAELANKLPVGGKPPVDQSAELPVPPAAADPPLKSGGSSPGNAATAAPVQPGPQEETHSPRKQLSTAAPEPAGPPRTEVDEDEAEDATAALHEALLRERETISSLREQLAKLEEDAAIKDINEAGTRVELVRLRQENAQLASDVAQLKEAVERLEAEKRQLAGRLSAVQAGMQQLEREASIRARVREDLAQATAEQPKSWWGGGGVDPVAEAASLAEEARVQRAAAAATIDKLVAENSELVERLNEQSALIDRLARHYSDAAERQEQGGAAEPPLPPAPTPPTPPEPRPAEPAPASNGPPASPHAGNGPTPVPASADGGPMANGHLAAAATVPTDGEEGAAGEAGRRDSVVGADVGGAGRRSDGGLGSGGGVVTMMPARLPGDPGPVGRGSDGLGRQPSGGRGHDGVYRTSRGGGSTSEIEEEPVSGSSAARPHPASAPTPHNTPMQPRPSKEYIVEPKPFSDSPLMGAPIRVASFLARFIAGTDLVKQSPTA